MQTHLHKIGAVQNSVYRACEEDDETLYYYLCHGPAFSSNRMKFLENDTIPDFIQLMGLEWKTIKKVLSEP